MNCSVLLRLWRSRYFLTALLTQSPDQHASMFLTHSEVYCALCCSSVAPGIKMIAHSLAAGVINHRLRLSGYLASNHHDLSLRSRGAKACTRNIYLSFVTCESCKLCTCLIIITLCVGFLNAEYLGNIYRSYKHCQTYRNSKVWSLQKCLTECCICLTLHELYHF